MARPSDHRPVVVGVDPDPTKRMALAWAADEAARRRVPLRLVHAEGVPTPGVRRGYVPPSWEEWNQALHEAGERVLKEAVIFAEARQPQVEVSALLAEGNPAWILREQSHDATAVVLGSWHLGRLKDVSGTASVALPVMAHAHCPVVVVPEPEHVTQQPAYFVVGVDGSAQSAAAVDFAFEEAALRSAALRALYVWQPGPLRVFDEYAVQQECRRLLSETVAGRGAAYPDVELHHELLSGHPVKVLAEESAHALGLVVGTRGHGGFAGMLLGSVSQGVLRYARCPVVAVPHTSV
ncbi:universal stress protein UspA [Streptomyces hygroscopicus]|uniref:universal stress protein n=1 Tax=Streptomyces hygroscopicus TaxID=1912 RepID=UPI00223F9BF9|nr:universal stress protein [Streptomyces hygroscopicus]MCW7942987.1 universal stress protein UspA [Streptomyces hygroscopicus]